MVFSNIPRCPRPRKGHWLQACWLFDPSQVDTGERLPFSINGSIRGEAGLLGTSVSG